ncbi:sugar ABC transporter substrate-binding protein [Halolactibacillus alkaliphilus]|uniref:Sugar ABC transporter substrate-binding protein n=1 Tax=Halolactibacillus alkaliphilus TaxID=442899 RepID=A0A511WZS9_9BACI|nr:extracellular solute-binding protein [Halolactibacillus alkaliphilus]GEN56202.1 sugar ABC transporter substrate-binding protein [Halolactibacillus alkaliphilus]GGN66596.1 sugar ABC transporter substrate-binding protein [Halolactibacillus alkaliphilus]SFO67961.1 cellobiose transport system substrate-binding protein [Halolactibacillus alkaliphilus]
MKKNLYLFITLVLTFFLTACNNGQESSGSSSVNQDDSPEKVELTFWAFGSTGYDELIEEYESMNEHVAITLQNAALADHHDSLFTTISAGSGAPDITMIELGFIEQYKEVPDRFYNLFDFGAKDIKDSFLDWKWDVGEIVDEDYLIGLPTDIGPTAMVYRTDVFEEAGLPSDPEQAAKLFETWEDFRKQAKIITESTGKPVTDSVTQLYNALRDQAPEQYFNTDNELIIESSPYIKEAYDYTVTLVADGVVGDIAAWTPEWGTAMDEGSFATLLAPSWMLGVVKGNAPDASGMWSIMTLPEGAGNWGGSYLAIPSQSEHPEEAYKFMEWLTSSENQLKSFESMGLFPSTPETYEQPGFLEYSDEYFGGINTAEIYAEAAEQVKSVYLGPNHSIANNEIIVALDNVLNEGGDPEKEWEDAIKRMKAQLDRQ